MEKEVEKYKLDLQNSLLENPTNIDLLIRLGVLEFEFFHNHEDAIELFEKAIEVEPNSVNARFWLAACLYYDFAEYEKAEPYLKDALQIDPNRPECLSLMASIIYGTNRPIDEAIQLVQNARRIAPNWPALRYQLAELFLAKGDSFAAEKEAREAFSLKTLPSELITNEVDRYYETVITGRAWKNLRHEFQVLIDKVGKL